MNQIRQTRIKDSLKHLEKMTLPTGGDLNYEHDPNGNRTSLEYDEMNRIVKVIDAVGASIKYEHNAGGYLTGITHGKSNFVKF